MIQLEYGQTISERIFLKTKNRNVIYTSTFADFSRIHYFDEERPDSLFHNSKQIQCQRKSPPADCQEFL